MRIQLFIIGVGIFYAVSHGAAAGIFQYDAGVLSLDSPLVIEGNNGDVSVSALMLEGADLQFTELTVDSPQVEFLLASSLGLRVTQNGDLFGPIVNAEEGLLRITRPSLAFPYILDFTSDHLQLTANNETSSLSVGGVLVSSVLSDVNKLSSNGMFVKGDVRVGGSVLMQNKAVVTRSWLDEQDFQVYNGHPYANVNHNHDAQYSRIGHNHTNFVKNVPANSPSPADSLNNLRVDGVFDFSPPETSPKSFTSTNGSLNGDSYLWVGNSECPSATYASGIRVYVTNGRGAVALRCRELSY